jgi:hypothetical protein
MHYLKTGLKKYRWQLIPQLLLAAIVAVMLVAGGAQTSQAASLAPQASSHCANPGALVQTIIIATINTEIAKVEIYYNSATGYNCAYTRAIGPAYGKTKQMAIAIDSCEQTSPGSKCTGGKHDYDVGQYKYFAGPAAVKAPGHCIDVYGSIFWEGQSYWGLTHGASHCG